MPTTQKPEARRRLAKLAPLVFWLAALTDASGALSLAVAHFLPKPPAHVAAANPTPPNGSQVVKKQASVSPHETRLQELQKELSTWGKILITTGSIAGPVTRLGSSVRNFQPSMLAGASVQLSLAPFLLFSQAVPLTTALLIGKAMFYQGFRNRVENQKRRAEGQPERELDFRDLLKNPNFRKAFSTVKFIIVDHKITVQAVGEMAKTGAGKLLTPRQSVSEMRHALLKANREARRRDRVEGKKFANANLNSLGSFLMYVGGIPLIFLSGAPHIVNLVASQILSMGVLINYTPMFQEGRRRFREIPTVIAGIPLIIAGTTLTEIVDPKLAFSIRTEGTALGPDTLHAYDAHHGKTEH